MAGQKDGRKEGRREGKEGRMDGLTVIVLGLTGQPTRAVNYPCPVSACEPPAAPLPCEWRATRPFICLQTAGALPHSRGKLILSAPSSVFGGFFSSQRKLEIIIITLELRQQSGGNHRPAGRPAPPFAGHSGKSAEDRC